jgi:drug/metabolite transporter (DMT)-like permease
MWFLLAIFAAFFQATTHAVAKKYQTKHNYIILTSASYLLNALILFTIVFIKGVPVLGPDFLKAVVSSGILNIFATICFYKSLQLTDLSLASPMLAFTPVFLSLNGYFILGEKPSLLGFLGIISVVLGIFFINSPKASRFFHAFHSIKKDKGILLMLLVAFIWSISTAFDKMAVLNSDFIFGSACVISISSIFFTFYALLKFRRKTFRLYKKGFTGAFLLAAASVSSNFFTNYAYMYALAAYVLSVKRLSVLLGVLLGIFVFKEPDLRKRLIGATIAVAGVLLIAFS